MFKMIQAEFAECALVILNGDLEVAVLDTGSNGDSCWTAIAMYDDTDGHLELMREEFATLREAAQRAVEFMCAEYEVGV